LYSFQTLAITAASVFVSGLSFLSSFVLARVFGLGSDIDEFLYATSIPLFIAGILSSYFMYGSVPILTEDNDLTRSASSLFLIACGFSSILLTVSLILKLGPNLSPTTFANITTTSKLQLLSIAYAIGGIQVIFGAISAIFNAKRYFIIPFLLQALTPIGAILGTIFELQSHNILFTMIGMLAGVSFSSLLGIIILRKNLIWIHLVSLKDSYRILNGNSGSFSTILASCAFTAFSVIDAQWAPQFGAGALSTLGYAQRIVIGFGNIAVIGIFTSAGTIFSESLQKYGDHNFGLIVWKSILKVAISAILLALILWSNLYYLIDLIFGKKIQTDQVEPLISILPLMLVGMVPMLCSAILLRAVLCLKNQNVYVFLFGVGVPIVYILFSWTLSYLGFLSIGYAYLISWFFGFGVLSFGIYRHNCKYK
jgi:putative peptidoglycan lipid II flippase